MAAVNIGDTVRIHYTGRFEDGTVFDSSQEREPLEFVAGSEMVIEGVSEGVVGMATGDKKSLVVPPEKAYGIRTDDAQEKVPRSNLPQDVSEGDLLAASRGGQQFPVRVEKLEDEQAVLDLNHPLAGRELHFDIELVEVVPGSPEEAAFGESGDGTSEN